MRLVEHVRPNQRALDRGLFNESGLGITRRRDALLELLDEITPICDPSMTDITHIRVRGSGRHVRLSSWSPMTWSVRLVERPGVPSDPTAANLHARKRHPRLTRHFGSHWLQRQWWPRSLRPVRVAYSLS